MKKYNNRIKKHKSNEKRHILREKKKKKIKDKYRTKFLQKNWKWKIYLLPKEIQKNIYIWTWRLYWRSYIPLIAKEPSWQKTTNIIKGMLWQAREKNIHFLHLPFNTLPEYRKWIMGCQCTFCLDDNEIDSMEKHCHSLLQYRKPSYFSDNLMPEETIGHWNENNILSGHHNNDTQRTLIKIYDPLCGSYKENHIIKKLRTGDPIHFQPYL